MGSDGDNVGFIEEDDEEEEEPQQEQTKSSVETEKEIPTSEPQKVISLPMTEASDAWMSDGDNVGFIEEDDDEEEEEPQQEQAKSSVEAETEIPSSEPQKVISFPMTEASEAWMSDGDNVGF